MAPHLAARIALLVLINQTMEGLCVTIARWANLKDIVAKQIAKPAEQVITWININKRSARAVHPDNIKVLRRKNFALTVLQENILGLLHWHLVIHVPQEHFKPILDQPLVIRVQRVNIKVQRVPQSAPRADQGNMLL